MILLCILRFYITSYYDLLRLKKKKQTKRKEANASRRELLIHPSYAEAAGLLEEKSEKTTRHHLRL